MRTTPILRPFLSMQGMQSFGCGATHRIILIATTHSGNLDICMRIAYLADHPQHVDTATDWAFSEWAWLRPGIKRQHVRDEFLQRMVHGQLPITLLALADTQDDLLGMVSIKCHEDLTLPGLSPWIGGMYVRKDVRGQRLGEQLMRAAEQEAQRQGQVCLYLSAADAESFYARMGWEVFERKQFAGEDIAVMRKTLGK